MSIRSTIEYGREIDRVYLWGCQFVEIYRCFIATVIRAFIVLGPTIGPVSLPLF